MHSQELSPEDFYNQLEEEGRVLEKIPDKADITNYVKIKLGLLQTDESRPDSPEVKYAIHMLINMLLSDIFQHSTT